MMIARSVPAFSIAVLAGTLAAGCTEPTDDEDVAPARGAIVQGDVDSRDPAVVALTVGHQAFCTGTLVAPLTVLTAGHCVEGTGIDAEDILVFFGTDVSEGGTFVPVMETAVHPDYNPDSEYFMNDLGMVRLAASAPTTPVPIPSGGFFTDYNNDPVRIVGFGVTYSGAGNSGIKKVANTIAAGAEGTLFVYEVAPSGTCNGDSGGPAFMDEDGVEVVAGVHSRSDCESLSIDERVDLHLEEFVLPYIAAEPVPTCAPDGFCGTGCTEVDVDCPCNADGFCTSSCTDVLEDPDCDPKCAAEGTCVMSGCPQHDPDCPIACAQNNVCEAGCPNDSDCSTGPACAADGACVAACPADPDCAPPPAPSDEDEGCSAAAPGSRGASIGLAIGLAVALFAGARRARRRFTPGA